MQKGHEENAKGAGRSVEDMLSFRFSDRSHELLFLFSVTRVDTKPITNAKKPYDPSMFSESWTGDAAQLQESLNKIKLLEYDYKSLHEKRLQDVNQFAIQSCLLVCRTLMSNILRFLLITVENFANRTRTRNVGKQRNRSPAGTTLGRTWWGVCHHSETP